MTARSQPYDPWDRKLADRVWRFLGPAIAWGLLVLLLWACIAQPRAPWVDGGGDSNGCAEPDTDGVNCAEYEDDPRLVEPIEP